MDPGVLCPLYIYILSFSFSCQHWLFLFCSSVSPLCKVAVHLHFLFSLWCNVGKTQSWSDLILLVWCQIAIKNNHTFSAVALKGRTADVALYRRCYCSSLTAFVSITADQRLCRHAAAGTVLERWSAACWWICREAATWIQAARTTQWAFCWLLQYFKRSQ